MAKHPSRHDMDDTAPQEMPAEDTAPAPVADDAPSAVLTIADMSVTVPLKFAAGAVLTDAQARILDAAYQRQFSNNQNAMAKARAERLTGAKTEAERELNAPLSAEALAAIYATYEPNVGNMARGSTLDRLRSTAAWQVWAETVAAHNKSVAAGGAPVIVRAGNAPVRLMTASRKSKGVSDEAHAAALADHEAAKAALIARLLAAPAYAERIQTTLDAMTAAKATAPAGSTVTVAGADLI